MYKFYCNNPNGNLQAGDCVIRAICKVTDELGKRFTLNFLLKVMDLLIVLSVIQLMISQTTTQKVRL